MDRRRRCAGKWDLRVKFCLPSSAVSIISFALHALARHMSTDIDSAIAGRHGHHGLVGGCTLPHVMLADDEALVPRTRLRVDMAKKAASGKQLFIGTPCT